jgi:hypothetical protein
LIHTDEIKALLTFVNGLTASSCKVCSWWISQT